MAGFSSSRVGRFNRPLAYAALFPLSYKCRIAVQTETLQLSRAYTSNTSRLPLSMRNIRIVSNSELHRSQSCSSPCSPPIDYHMNIRPARDGVNEKMTDGLTKISPSRWHGDCIRARVPFYLGAMRQRRAEEKTSEAQKRLALAARRAHIVIVVNRTTQPPQGANHNDPFLQ